MANRNYRYSYAIRPENDEKAFLKTRKLIGKSIKGLKKEKLITDVDGSHVQLYYLDDQKIAVYNDFDIGAVYVNSDIPLEEILGTTSVW